MLSIREIMASLFAPTPVNQNCVLPRHREYATVLFGGVNEHIEWVLNTAAQDGYYIQQVVYNYDSRHSGQVILWKRKVDVAI